MQSFNQKTRVDLPNIRKRQTYKNKENEADYFNLLFEDGYGLESTLPENIGQRERFLKGYHFYIAIVFILFIAACSFVVQMVVNSPEIEKYKTIAKNIEDVDTEESDVVKPINKPINIVKQPKQIISRKIDGSREIKQKTITRPLQIVVQKSSQINKLKPQSVTLKKPETKVQEAIVDIMLRPAVSSESELRGLSKNN